MKHEQIEEWLHEVDRVSLEAWEQSGRVDDVRERRWVTVGQVLDEPEPDEESIERWKEHRLACVQALLDFLWADGPHPIKALKRLFAITRRAVPHYLGHMTLEQVSTLLNETKQATQHREERVWEKFLEQQGFLGTRAPRSKSDEARAKYSEQRKGSQSRLGGKKALRKYSALRSKQPAKDQPQRCG